MVRIFSILLLAITIVWISACKKDSDIGLNTQPGSDKINIVYTDTVEIEAFSVNVDSVASSNNSLALLGSYNDPIFGYSSASFMAQLRLSKIAIDFPANGTFVSLDLIIQTNGFYGNASASQTLEVYELTKRIEKDSTYFSNLNVNDYINSSQIVGTTLFKPSANTSDSIVISLSSALGNKLFYAFDSLYYNQEYFKNLFYGLYVSVDGQSAGDAIGYFNLLGPKTRMVLKYQNPGESTVQEFNFVINSNSARVNVFKHDYQNTAFYNQITTSAPIQDSVFYVQSIAGVRGLVKVKNAEKWALKNNIAILKAELLLPIENDVDTGTYKIPSKMQLVRINDENKYSFLEDYYLGAQYFDGNYNAEGKYYKFNIAKYLQRVVTGEIPNYGLILFPENNAVSANRVVLTSGLNSNKIKLLVSYTKF